MQLVTVKIDKPEDVNFILGQTHFIKSVEDLHEALVGAVPGIKFGLAFCEASGKCLVRWSGTDPAMIEIAQKNAQAIAAHESPRTTKLYQHTFSCNGANRLRRDAKRRIARPMAARLIPHALGSRLRCSE